MCRVVADVEWVVVNRPPPSDRAASVQPALCRDIGFVRGFRVSEIPDVAVFPVNHQLRLPSLVLLIPRHA